MYNMEIKDVKPQNSNLVVEVKKLDEVVDSIYVGNQNTVEEDAMPTEFYVGEIHSLGKTAASKLQCPEAKVGGLAIFSQWAGQVIPTEDVYAKVITGHNIVATTKNLKMETKDINPTGDRILVEIITEDKEKDGIYMDVQDDPRNSVTQKGKVIKCAQNADHYKVGTFVYFEPFDGSLIVNKPGLQLKTLNSRSILFAI